MTRIPPVPTFVAATVVTAGLVAGAVALVAPTAAGSPTGGARHTIFVSLHGSDAHSGQADHPLRTIQAAVDRSPAGGTIVVRPGSYHESVTIGGKDGLTIRAARRGTVWLDGSQRVRGWHASGSVWVHAGWHHEFNASPTFTWNAPDNPNPNWSFVNPAHPMAAHPDQVFVDGARLRQVGSLQAVRGRSFYVDYGSHRLYVGTNPAGRAVRATTIAKALTIQSAGVTVDGISVRKFGPSVPAMGAITVERPHVTLSHLSVIDNATTGAFIGSTDDRVDGVRFRHNGLMGFMATYADRLKVRRVAAVGNNTELFNQSPAAGGAKIGRTDHVTIRASRFDHNHATGLWLDESTYAMRILRSRMIGNAGHGISLEVSGRALVAGNVVAGNAGNGIKINDTDHVQLWNNTFAGNARPIAVLQDNRDVNPSGSYHDPSLPLPWVNREITIRNNVVARAGAGSDCLLCVQDYTGRWTAEQLDVTADSNVYQRVDSRSPSGLVLWSRGPGAPAVFATIQHFKVATGQERSHLLLTGRPAVTATYRPTAAVRGHARQVAQPLPAWIAHLTRRPAGSHWLGAWFHR